jgi:hypothetical protein
VIKEAYPLEYSVGGLIDWVDSGELHALLANFQEQLVKRGIIQNTGVK